MPPTPLPNMELPPVTSPHPDAVHIMSRGSAGSAALSRYLGTIAAAFVRTECTPFYLEDPAAQAHAFWASLAQDVLDMLPHDAPALYTLEDGSAAAMVYLWQPELPPASFARCEALLRPHEGVRQGWKRLGERWEHAEHCVYELHGPFLDIGFLAVAPGQARAGRGRRLLQAALSQADKLSCAVFLGAQERQNRDWYARYGFRAMEEVHQTVAGLPGEVHITFMVRPPTGSTPASGTKQHLRWEE